MSRSSSIDRLPPPDPERIAAYLDGGLSPEEQAEVRRLLAESAAWREVLLEAQDLEEWETLDEAASTAGEVRRFPGRDAARRDAPTRSLLLAAAAAIVALAVTAPFWLRLLSPGPSPSSQLVDRIAVDERLDSLPPDWSYPEWGSFRSATTSPIAASPHVDFRLGVLAIKLEVARRRGDAVELGDVASALDATLVADLTPISELTLEQIRPDLDRLGTAPAQRQVAERIDRELIRSFAAGGLFEVGRWAATALIAARTGDDAHFAARTYRDGLAAVRELDLPTVSREPIDALAAPGLDAATALPLLERLVATLGDPETWAAGV